APGNSNLMLLCFYKTAVINCKNNRSSIHCSPKLKGWFACIRRNKDLKLRLIISTCRKADIANIGRQCEKIDMPLNIRLEFNFAAALLCLKFDKVGIDKSRLP